MCTAGKGLSLEIPQRWQITGIFFASNGGIKNLQCRAWWAQCAVPAWRWRGPCLLTAPAGTVVDEPGAGSTVGAGCLEQVLKHPGNHGAEERLVVNYGQSICSGLLTFTLALQRKVRIYRRCPVICSKSYCDVQDKFEKAGCLLPVKVWSKTVHFQS